MTTITTDHAALDTVDTDTVDTVDTDTVDTVEDGRARIDELDAALRALIVERRAVSRRVQELRAAAGGPRIQHSRESRVVSSWTHDLGPHGGDIARALLALCRGPLTLS